MDLQTAISILKKEQATIDANKFDGILLQFMGGEPLLCFSLIRELCEWIWSQSFKIPILNISFPTNGTLINKQMREWFAINKNRIQPMLSFDGNRLMQNRNRSNSARLVDLEYFASTFPNTAIKMTISPETIDCIYDGIIFLYDNGLTHVEANLAYGKELKWEKYHLKVLLQQLTKLVDFYLENPNVTPMAMVSMPVWAILDFNREPMRCQLGDNLVCYDCDGISYPCHLFSPLTLEGSQLELARHIDFASLHNEESSKCKKCLLRPLCLTCYGLNYMDTGDCNNQTPFNCAQFQLFFLASCRYHKLLALSNNDTQKTELISKVMNLLKLSTNKKST